MIAAADCGDFHGMSLAAASAIIDKPPNALKAFLYQRGYRFSRGRFMRIPSITEVETEIAQRVAARASAPCWRCGCRVCAHQEAVAA